MTRALGHFIGGALRYFPDDDGQAQLRELPEAAAQVLDTHAGFVLFDGKRGHSVCDFIGARYSLVFFSISQYEKVPLDQRGPLLNYPEEGSMRPLQKLLAPPRGYSDGLRQKSIEQAFGFAGKKQALRWQPTDWSQLPPTVLLRIARYAGVPPSAVLSKRALQDYAAVRKQLGA